MIKETDQPNYEEDEITLKEVILKGQEFYRELLKYWIFIVLSALLFGGYFFYKAKQVPITYPASITFMLNEDSGGGGGGVGALLGQFGFGGGGRGEYNLDKIIELSKSMRITREALFEKVELDGVSDYFANHLIRIEKLHEKWKKDTTGLNGFLFTRATYDDFSTLENKALKKVYGKVKGNPEEKINGIFSAAFGEDTGILTMSINSQSEPFSIRFLEQLYGKVSEFYIKESTDKPKKTYTTLKEKQDSLKQELYSKEYQMAKAMDRSTGLVSKSAGLEISRLQRDVQILTIAYGEALKNAEMSEFALKNAMPFFQVIDRPIAPLSKKKKSGLKAIILGGFIGGFLGVLIFVSRKILRDTLKE